MNVRKIPLFNFSYIFKAKDYTEFVTRVSRFTRESKLYGPLGDLARLNEEVNELKERLADAQIKNISVINFFYANNYS